jgi:hypothetical protein
MDDPRSPQPEPASDVAPQPAATPTGTTTTESVSAGATNQGTLGAGGPNAAGTPGPRTYSPTDVLVVSGVLIGAAILLTVVLLLARKWMLDRGAGSRPSSAGILDQMRALRDRGAMSPEEFVRLEARLKARLREEIRAGAAPGIAEGTRGKVGLGPSGGGRPQGVRTRPTPPRE